jgi:hypothetical protein
MTITTDRPASTDQDQLVRKLLAEREGLRELLDRAHAGGATVVRIETVRRQFGWPV